MMKLLLIALLGTYVVLIVTLYLIQDGLIFPGRVSQGRPEGQIRPPKDGRIVELKAKDGEKIVALHVPATSPDGQILPDAKSRPTILYFYGNGQCVADSLVHVAAMRRLGLNVLMPDYLGYGQSGGVASETGCYATADAAYDYLVKELKVAPEDLVIGGFSLGGAVAIDLAARRPASGLIVSCTFTSMTDMASGQHPYIPAGLLLKHRFDSLEKIARIACPILIGSGRLDAIIPAPMIDRLASAAKGPVTRITLENAGHDDLIRVADGRDAAALARFIEELRAARSPANR